MEAPQAPINIKLVLGSEADLHDLAKVQLDVSDNEEQIKSYLNEKKLPQMGINAVLVFDLKVEPGKEQEAVDYFDKQKQEVGAKSPLQILFKKRPPKKKQQHKFSIQKHDGFIRILYNFQTQQGHSEIQQINQTLEIFKNNDFKFEGHLDYEIKGVISHNKKNRANVKVDYVNIQLSSNAFSSKYLFQSLTSIEGVNDQLGELVQNPFFDLLKKAKAININMKMDSPRKILKYYKQITSLEDKQVTKQFKYLSKGIFRQSVDIGLMYYGRYLIRIKASYSGEEVLLRLLKVYAKFFEKVLDDKFYKDD